MQDISFAEQFLWRLHSGEFDGRVYSAIETSLPNNCNRYSR